MIISKATNIETTYDYRKIPINIFFICVIFHLYSGFISENILGKGNIINILRAIADVTIIYISLFSFKQKSNRTIGIFIGVFFLLSFMTYVVNYEFYDIITHFNGLREPMLFFSSLSIFNYILNSNGRIQFLIKFNKFIMFFAVSQIPISLMQYIEYGAGDYVGGSFGNGGSGMMTILMFVIVFYFIVIFASDKEYSTIRIKKMLPYLILFIPIFINETKISAFILVIFTILLTFNRKKIGSSILVLIFSALFAVLFSFVYDNLNRGEIVSVGDFTDFFDSEFLFEYTYGGDQFLYSDSDLPRFYKISLLWDALGSDLNLVLFGKGYGIFKGQNVLGVSDVQTRYLHMYRGSKTLITAAVLQGGVFLLFTILTSMYYFLVKGFKKSVHFNNKRYILFLIIIFTIMIPYNDGIFVNFFSVIYSYFIMFAYNEDKLLKAFIDKE